MALREKSKQKSFPNIYISGIHLGGYGSLLALQRNGLLKNAVNNMKKVEGMNRNKTWVFASNKFKDFSTVWNVIFVICPNIARFNIVLERHLLKLMYKSKDKVSKLEIHTFVPSVCKMKLWCLGYLLGIKNGDYNLNLILYDICWIEFRTRRFWYFIIKAFLIRSSLNFVLIVYNIIRYLIIRRIFCHPCIEIFFGRLKNDAWLLFNRISFKEISQFK